MAKFIKILLGIVMGRIRVSLSEVNPVDLAHN
jgi:hypothetical protein